MWRYTSRCLCVGLSLDKEHNSIFAKRLIFPGGLFKYWWRLRKTFPVTCANFIILFFNIQQFCTSLAKRRMSVSHHDCSCRQLGLEYIALWHTCTYMGTFPCYISVFLRGDQNAIVVGRVFAFRDRGDYAHGHVCIPEVIERKVPQALAGTWTRVKQHSWMTRQTISQLS